MTTLISQRCLNHASREAVARCPECTRFFCRECITEHDDRVLCASCLKKLARTPLTRRPAFANFIRLCQCAIAILAVWFFFFVIGEKLSREPNTFHKDALWHVPWIDQE
jgi:hypothetical protein